MSVAFNQLNYKFHHFIQLTKQLDLLEYTFLLLFAFILFWLALLGIMVQNVMEINHENA